MIISHCRFSGEYCLYLAGRVHVLMVDRTKQHKVWFYFAKVDAETAQHKCLLLVASNTSTFLASCKTLLVERFTSSEKLRSHPHTLFPPFFEAGCISGHLPSDSRRTANFPHAEWSSSKSIKSSRRQEVQIQNLDGH